MRVVLTIRIHGSGIVLRVVECLGGSARRDWQTLGLNSTTGVLLAFSQGRGKCELLWQTLLATNLWYARGWGHQTDKWRQLAFSGAALSLVFMLSDERCKVCIKFVGGQFNGDGHNMVGTGCSCEGSGECDFKISSAFCELGDGEFPPGVGLCVTIQ